MKPESTQVLFRRARPSDQETIVEFNRRLALETEGKALDLNLLRPGVAAAIERPDLCLCFVAESSGEVIGQLMVTYEWSDWHNRLYWWLQSVYVHEAHRGKGVFRDLFEFVREEAKRSNAVHAFCLYVDKENHRAKRTYHGLGFEMSNYDIMECVL